MPPKKLTWKEVFSISFGVDKDAVSQEEKVDGVFPLVTNLDPNRLMLKTYLNGELKQQDSTENCVFSIQKVLSYISRYMTLFPGDIVTTGTPKGIAPMQPGDTVVVEIEGLGSLRNKVEPDSMCTQND